MSLGAILNFFIPELMIFSFLHNFITLAAVEMEIP